MTVVETRVALALVNVNFAALAGVAGSAVAPVIVDQIHASATVLARVGSAVVLVDLTEAAAEARGTDADERVHAILAGGAVQTVIRLAVVDVELTSGDGWREI